MALNRSDINQNDLSDNNIGNIGGGGGLFDMDNLSFNKDLNNDKDKNELDKKPTNMTNISNMKSSKEIPKKEKGKAENVKV